MLGLDGFKDMLNDQALLEVLQVTNALRYLDFGNCYSWDSIPYIGTRMPA